VPPIRCFERSVPWVAIYPSRTDCSKQQSVARCERKKSFSDTILGHTHLISTTFVYLVIPAFSINSFASAIAVSISRISESTSV